LGSKSATQLLQLAVSWPLTNEVTAADTTGINAADIINFDRR